MDSKEMNAQHSAKFNLTLLQRLLFLGVLGIVIALVASHFLS